MTPMDTSRGRRRLVMIAAVVSALLVPAAEAPAASQPGTGDAPLSASVLTPPRPVPATDQRTHLVYEVLLQNRSAQPVSLDRVVVRDAARSRVLADHDGDAIERLLLSFADGQFTRTLDPDESGILVLDVRLRPGDPAPARLTHRFTLTPGPLTIADAETGVDRRPPVRVAPPLVGSDLGVLGCCGPPFSHRLALLDIDGQSFLAQRYAIDFVQLDDGVNTFTGDPARNESYFIFGDDITAVGSGRVVAARDGVPENTPPTPPANPGIEDAAGNFVVQSLGSGSFALYAHLQTGSVRVRPGDRLERGQVLGLVGNTGNSTQPHLHFHVTDGPGPPSTLAAEGVPYIFDRFRLGSQVIGLDADPPAPVRVPAPPPPRRAGQYPLTGDVVDFR